ncbi:UNVERIFIED_CONTAM: hypothetical protein FKN15_063732 [Acipenser sinensis]
MASVSSLVSLSGFCVKTNTSDGRKVFVNICQSSQVPPPPDISEAELVELLQSEDPSGFRLPMSLGEPHAEIDNSEQSSELVLEFLIAVSFEGLENKYDLQLCRELGACSGVSDRRVVRGARE